MSMKKVNCLLNYNVTSEQLIKVVDDYITKYETIVAAVIATDNIDLAWVNIIKPFIELDNITVDLALLDMKDFHQNKEIRDVCSKLSDKLSTWSIEQSMRKDLYEKYKYYSSSQYNVEKPFLSCEENTYFTNMMQNYSLAGMELPDEKFEELKEIKKSISTLCNDFQQNLGEENYVEYLKPEELDGLPSNYISSRLNDNMVKVTLKYPDYVPIMEYATNRDLRKRLSTLFKSRCIKSNSVIMEKVFKLRQKVASILGYTNYSDYKLVKSMAGSSETVNKFLNDLHQQIKPVLQQDLNIMNSMHGDNIEQWDVAYYSRIYTEKTCNFDKEAMKEYFPVDIVVSGTFEIYQKLLSFKFMKQPYSTDFWHESVELYKVYDMTCMSLDMEDSVVGYFYLDLYPREGKYSHAACFPYITKSSNTDAVATMACNFGKDNLTFDEVETFFHEFGHVMHHLSSGSTIKDLSSFSCEHDFVETPSQMFEEWCYMPETLKMMSKNLPQEMILKLNQSRKMFQGYHYARQLVFGMFDMKIHSTNETNPTILFSMIQKDILGLETIPGTSEPASFGHLMGGYDAGYYGYAWSLVYAKDLFSMFKDNLLDPKLGLKLRTIVLSQGSMRKSLESVKEFLGREPSNKPFIDSIM